MLDYVSESAGAAGHHVRVTCRLFRLYMPLTQRVATYTEILMLMLTVKSVSYKLHKNAVAFLFRVHVHCTLAKSSICMCHRARLQVYRVANKGWAVRSMLRIPKGSYVCE